MKPVVSPSLLGFYINPDELEAEARRTGYFDAAPFGVTPTADEIAAFFASHPLLRKANLVNDAVQFTFADGKLHLHEVALNSYFAAVWADFLRQRLLEKGASFSFETVMSSRDKVTLLHRAREMGFRTYILPFWFKRAILDKIGTR